MAQTASIRLTLSNIATEEDVNNLREDQHAMEERIMSALSDAITQLRATVESLSVAQSPEKVQELEAAVQREREANEALVAKAVEVETAEELEDTAQAQELADAKAANDALIAEMNSAAGDLGAITEQLSAVGTAVDEAPAGTPVEEVPVDLPPAPLPDVPADGGGPADANPTADPSSPTTTDEAGTTAGTGTDAPAGGPVDASGAPVEGPNL